LRGKRGLEARDKEGREKVVIRYKSGAESRHQLN